jgi:hypothetical protein
MRVFAVMGVVCFLAFPLAGSGEAVNGFPTWEERVIHQWINRARVEPQYEMSRCGAACAESACYKPNAPLFWAEALNRAARFHADEMVQQGFFGHDSQCAVVPNIDNLYPVGCNGAASCGCTGGAVGCAGGACTSWHSRVRLFGAAPSGEIVASPADPNQAFYLWLYEPASINQCGYNAYNGHRYLILESTGGVGVGVSGYSVADFGGGGVPYRIASGSHYPRQAATVEVWANWYDTQAPRAASVVVDGQCIPMRLTRGSGTNGAWSATVSGVGSGCHRYYFSFIDASGAEVTYPATGSLGIGATSCADWNSSRAIARCSTTEGRRRSVRR